MSRHTYPLLAGEGFVCADDDCRCKLSADDTCSPKKKVHKSDKVDLQAAAELWVDVDPTVMEPPANFGIVQPGLYRSAFPQPANYSYLDSLGIQTVLCLVDDEPLPQQYLHWLRYRGIRLVHVGLPGHKEAFRDGVPVAKIVDALSCILDYHGYPTLVHCNRGKHRTGTLIGCLRRVAGWHTSRVLDEYRRYSHPKERFTDMNFIEQFRPESFMASSVRQGIANMPDDANVANVERSRTSGHGSMLNVPSPVLPARSPELTLPAFA
ncbi:tyrosine-protein phosphatase siw14 [Savitreella phatthalungensis]